MQKHRRLFTSVLRSTTGTGTAGTASGMTVSLNGSATVAFSSAPAAPVVGCCSAAVDADSGAPSGAVNTRHAPFRSPLALLRETGQALAAPAAPSAALTADRAGARPRCGAVRAPSSRGDAACIIGGGTKKIMRFATSPRTTTKLSCLVLYASTEAGFGTRVVAIIQSVSPFEAGGTSGCSPTRWAKHKLPRLPPPSTATPPPGRMGAIPAHSSAPRSFTS